MCSSPVASYKIYGCELRRRIGMVCCVRYGVNVIINCRVYVYVASSVSSTELTFDGVGLACDLRS